MEMVIATAGRITALIRRLLAFSRQQPVAPQVIVLNEVVEGLRGMMKRLIGEDLQLETVLAPDLWRTRVDPTQVEQIVVNLLVNAREASPRGGKVTIETANASLRPETRATPAAPAGDYVLLASPTTAAASRPRSATVSSSRSSPPRRGRRRAAWGSPPSTASSSRTAAT